VNPICLPLQGHYATIQTMTSRLFRVRPSIFLGGTALIAALMMTIVLIPQALSRHARLEVLRGHVGEVARVAASVVDGDVHRLLVETRNATPAERTTALVPLLALHRAWPEAKYIYTMGAHNGEAFFVLDTAQDAVFAQERNLRASQYLEPFRVRREYASNWLEELAAGHTYVNPEYQHDDYGYFLTGHAPIHDKQGRVAGFLGVDFDLGYAMAEEARFHRIELASVVGALLLSLLLGYVYARYHFSQQEELQLHYESSMNDSLTGLLNRRGADAAIRAAISGRGAAVAQRSHAVLLVDIDHFKSINDTHGHAEGDAVIERVACALRKSGQRPGDVLARLGGDEFLIFLPDCDLVRAQQIAERLLAEVYEDGRRGGVPFEVSVGVGVARAEEGDFDFLYRRADLALYQAKAAGKNRYSVFDPGNNAT
jgi:diguanylate cyclase (GGDEF)-like protein